jgi:uncharacterized membrane protein YjfL (UPF0719 family)
MDVDGPTRFAFAAATAVLLLVLLHALQRLVSPRHTVTGDAKGPNTAYVLVQAGHVLALLLLVPGIVKEALTHDSLAHAALWAGLFSLVGVVLIELVGEVGIRLLLRSTLRQELERGNVAAGLAAGANHAAVGIIAAPSIAGSDVQGLGLAIGFFGLAVVTLALCVMLFRALTTYDDAEQIQGDNLAAAVSYAGISVATAIILARALKGGDFEGWGPALTGFGSVAASALALYPVRQVIVQGLILGRRPTLRGGSLDDAIGSERSAGLAALEALAYVATAVAISELS